MLPNVYIDMCLILRLHAYIISLSLYILFVSHTGGLQEAFRN